MNVIANTTKALKTLGWIPSESRFKNFNVYSHPDFPSSRVRIPSPITSVSSDTVKDLAFTLKTIASLHKISKNQLISSVLDGEKRRLRQRNNRRFQIVDFTKCQFIRHGIGTVTIWQDVNEFGEYRQDKLVSIVSRITWDRLKPVISDYLVKIGVDASSPSSQFITQDAAILLNILFRLANQTTDFKECADKVMLLPTEDLYFWHQKLMFSGKHPRVIIGAMRKVL